MARFDVMEQAKRIDKAVSSITASQVFFGSLLTGMEFAPVAAIKTLDCDGVTIRYNPAYVAKLSDAELMGVLAHEVLHPALGHLWRMMGRDGPEWNRSCDYGSNLILTDAKFTLPPNVLLDEQYRNMSEDEIYARRMADRKAQQEQEQAQEPPEPQGDDEGDDQSSPAAPDSPDDDSDDENGEGENSPDDQGEGSDDSDDGEPTSGQGSDGGGSGDSDQQSEDYGGCGEMRMPPNADGTAEKATSEDIERMKSDWEVRTFQAAQLAKKAGQLPGSLERLIDEMKKPEIDPCDLLREFMLARAKSDFRAFPFNRRYLPMGVYMPSLHSDRLGNVVIAVDTSGSVGEDELRLFEGWVNSVLADTLPEQVTVIYADATVQHVEVFTADDYPVRLTLRGGGGTDCRPVFDYVAKLDDEPDCFMYLTDMDFYSGFPDDPGYPVLWMSTLYGADHAPAWGEVVMMHQKHAA